MIDEALFFRLVAQLPPKGYDLSELTPIIEPGPGQSMQIIAGAGTGKTTALTFKCLHAIFVRGLPPESIIATTFTKKAARELQSRILDLGESFVAAAAPHVPPETLKTMRHTDLNKIRTGTLDSIIQEVLTEFKEFGHPPPIPVEPFVARGLMIKVGLHRDGRYRKQALTDYLSSISGLGQKTIPDGRGGRVNYLSIREKATLLCDLRAFLITSNVARQAYLDIPARLPGAAIAFEAIEEFDTYLRENGIADYTLLAHLFLNRLESQSLNDFCNTIRLILVDEYQDTEHLQERIYFALARPVIARGGALVVVGDDDQALYRFRGATVGLFTGFESRFQRHFDARPLQRPLVINRRSTPEIIRYCQGYLEYDPAYAAARTPKPKLHPPEGTPDSGVPVYLLHAGGNDAQALARRACDVILAVLNPDRGWQPPTPGSQPILRDREKGTPSDIAIIAPSAKESGSANPTFLGYLRQELWTRAQIPLFNPRGRSLGEVPQVATLLGLLLECFDPGSRVSNDLGLPQDVVDELQSWRVAAGAYLAQPQTPQHIQPGPGKTLASYVRAVANARAVPDPEEDTYRRLAISEVMYRLVTWMQFFQDDVEGLAYFEVLQRCIGESKHLGKFQGNVEYNEHGHVVQSVEEAIWNFFVPLAVDQPDLDEELLVTLPPKRVSVLTAHQAKGLEFPMVIMDAGTNLKDDRAFRPARFPDRTEDRPNVFAREFADFAGYIDTSRSSIDQRFDDVVRKHFVAASRAQQVLVILTHSNGLARRLPNVATWTRRDGTIGNRDAFVQVIQ